MSIDNSIPGYPELFDWPDPIVKPVQNYHHGWYRDAGTYYVDLIDASGKVIPFFFDNFLGRLCYGSSYETGADAAFIRRGSSLESEVFSLLQSLVTESGQYDDLIEKIEHAKVWTK